MIVAGQFCFAIFGTFTLPFSICKICLVCNFVLFARCPVNRACLHFEIADDLSSRALALITSTYSAQLRDGHKVLCGWRDSPCPTGFGTFPAQTTLQLINAHKERAASLAGLPCLPPLNAGRVRTEIYATVSSSGSLQDHFDHIASTALTNTRALWC